MRIGGTRKYNCTFSVPGGNLGTFKVVATTLGYGMNIVTNQGEGRAKRVLYPWVRTSGTWYVETVHGNREERDALNGWLLGYTKRVSSPHVSPPMGPITVTVPSRDFVKVGYPTGTIDFGDDANSASWKSLVQFSSASDATLSSLDGSQFDGPGGTAENFYPRGNQDSNYVEPYDEMEFVDPEMYWGAYGPAFTRNRLAGRNGNIPQ